MNNKLKSTKEVIKTLKCGRSTFYEHLKKTGIKPKKQGNKSFFTPEQIDKLKDSLHYPENQADTDKQRTDDRQTRRTGEPEPNKFTDYLKAELDNKNKELKEAQKQIQTLSGQVGHWQGMAQAYQEQNIKLLEEKKESPKDKIIEINEDKKSIRKKKKSFWKILWGSRNKNE